jgi:tetratricopeptide (TPR) repeat protein
VFGVATFIATAFAIQYGYSTYQRYRLERTFGHYYALIGKEFLDRGQYRRALAAFDEANKLMPLDIDVYYDRVQAFAFLRAIEKEQSELAEVQCKLVILHNPRNAEAYKYLGIIYGDKQNFSDAEAAFKKAIQLKGGHYDEAEYDLGKLYAEHAKRFSRLWPNESTQRMSLLQQALTTNDGLIKRTGDVRALYNNAADFALLGDADKAVLSLKTALEKGFDRYHVIAEDSDIDNIRDDPRFRELIRSRYTDIIVKHRGFVERGDSTPQDFHVLAWIQLFSGDATKINDGIEYARQALASEPKNPAYLGTSAQLYAAAGDRAAALEAVEAMIEKDPSRVYYVTLRKSWERKTKAR